MSHQLDTFSFLVRDKASGVETIGERFRWITRNRTQPDGKPVSARQISMSAKSPRKPLGHSQAWAGQIIRGDTSGKTVTWEECVSIAQAFDVSAHWLWTGEGAPDDVEVVVDDPIPTRAIVIAQARTFVGPRVPQSVFDAAIKQFKTRRYDVGDPGAEVLHQDFRSDLEDALRQEREYDRLVKSFDVHEAADEEPEL